MLSPGARGPASPLRLLVLSGSGFEIVDHFSKQGHGEEAALLVLKDQPVRRRVRSLGWARLGPLSLPSGGGPCRHGRCPLCLVAPSLLALWSQHSPSSPACSLSSPPH